MTKNNGLLLASGYAFYDFENSDGSRPHVPLSDETKKDVAHDADFREAYVSVRFMANDMPTRLRVGKQVLNWGQANFFQGINSLNPVNIPQLQMPGGGLDDLHRGQDMVWGLIAAVIYSGYRIDKRYHGELQKELATRRQQRASAPATEGRLAPGESP